LICGGSSGKSDICVHLNFLLIIVLAETIAPQLD
jgi:hypothetical protein